MGTAFRRSPAVAVVVVIMSVAWAASAYRLDHGVAASALTLLASAMGLIAAVGLWHGSSWSMRAYVAFAVLALLAHVARDAQVEPVQWNIAVGAAILTAILLVLGFAARPTRAPSATPSR